MFHTKRATTFAGVVAGAALLAFVAPAATADSAAPASNTCPTVTPTPTPAPTPEPSMTPLSAIQKVVSDRPDNPGKSGEEHGNSGKDKSDKSNNGNNGDNGKAKGDTVRTKDQKRAQDCLDQTAPTRAELREQIRLNGGSWGAYQRQETLVRVATKLAERYGASPEAPKSASLGRILTLINTGLPADLQIDVQTFLAEYELTLADIKWPTNSDEPSPEPSPSPSPEPSESPSPSPSPSPSASPSASPSPTA